MAEALRIAIVGAESTGKTELARALAARIAAETGLACTWVGEQLRAWCEREGRTPRRDEQAAIARAQAEAIDDAAAAHDLVVADTTPLMTAVYSRMIFADDSLAAAALDYQRRCDATLLTALDLPWIADGLQRDGPHVRLPVDSLVRSMLAASGLTWSLVAGSGAARLDSALDAVAPLLRGRTTPRRGLFTRLAERNAEDKPWRCELCDDPGCEHRLRGG
ncbi:MAG: AAA family ATPase [Burkholderiales bacterium]|nr:AAA family ATPase [Burkholderiales bacterium]